MEEKNEGENADDGEEDELVVDGDHETNGNDTVMEDA